MTSSRPHTFVQRLSAAATLFFALVCANPALAESMRCTAERFSSGKLTLPTYDEAMTDCVAQESAMTHPESGEFDSARSCYDIVPRGHHGPWRHGRIAVDLVERRSGDRYTFEGLWMCKPIVEAEVEAAASALRR
jgi:hypothetical protein